MSGRAAALGGLLVLPVLAGCRTTGDSHSPSPAVEAQAYLGSSARPSPGDLGTAGQLELVADLAQQVSHAEELALRLRESSGVLQQAIDRTRLRLLAAEIDRRRRELDRSGVLEGEIVLVSMRADVELPLDELLEALREIDPAPAPLD